VNVTKGNEKPPYLHEWEKTMSLVEGELSEIFVCKRCGRNREDEDLPKWCDRFLKRMQDLTVSPQKRSKRKDEVECMRNNKFPLIISIEGGIGVGKSTIIKKLAKSGLLEEVFPALTVAYLSEPLEVWMAFGPRAVNVFELFYVDRKRYSLLFQVMAQVSLFEELLSKFDNNKTIPDIIITERSIEASQRIFTEQLHSEGFMTKFENDICNYLYQSLNKLISVDGRILLDTDEHTMEKRINTRNRQGESPPLEYLSALRERHLAWRRDTAKTCRWRQIDTTEEESEEQTTEILKVIVEFIHSLLRGGQAKGSHKIIKREKKATKKCSEVEVVKMLKVNPFDRNLVHNKVIPEKCEWDAHCIRSDCYGDLIYYKCKLCGKWDTRDEDFDLSPPKEPCSCRKQDKPIIKMLTPINSSTEVPWELCYGFNPGDLSKGPYRIYAVGRGHKIGLFSSWYGQDGAKAATDRFSNGKYKAFEGKDALEKAWQFIRQWNARLNPAEHTWTKINMINWISDAKDDIKRNKARIAISDGSCEEGRQADWVERPELKPFILATRLTDDGQETVRLNVWKNKSDGRFLVWRKAQRRVSVEGEEPHVQDVLVPEYLRTEDYEVIKYECPNTGRILLFPK